MTFRRIILYIDHKIKVNIMRKVILELCAGALFLLELITYPLYSGISGRGISGRRIGKEYNTLWAIIGFILVIQILTLIIARKKDKDEFRYGVTLIISLQVLYIIILLTSLIGEVDPFMAMAIVVGIAALLLTIGVIVYVLSTWIARKQREKKEENSRDDRVISY